jgi:putative membrane protein
MRPKLRLPSLLFSVASLVLAAAPAGCARDSTAKTATAKIVDPDSPSDAQILGVLVAAHEDGVDFSRPGVTAAADPQVRAYAQKMVAQHGDGVDKAHQAATVTHIAPAPSRLAEKLQTATRHEREKLEPPRAPSRDQDIAFMCGELRLHQDLLQVIDEKLDPAVQDPRVKAELTATRPVVESHVEAARSIVQNLSGLASTTACQ